MSEMNSHLDIALASIKCFTDDGTLDLGELNFLLGLALRDKRVDEEERRVLRNIFSKVSEAEVTPVVWKRIREIKKNYDL